MYKRVLAATDLNDEMGWRKPMLVAAEHARKFGAELVLVSVLREIEAFVYAQTGPFAYDVVMAGLKDKLAQRVREIGADDLHPVLMVTHGESIYAEILRVAEEVGADLIVIGSHRPAMKDYLLGTNAGRVVRHARCSVLVVRE